MPRVISGSGEISSSPFGRLRALPTKGRSQRKQAIGAYLGTAVALATAAGFATLDVNRASDARAAKAASADDLKFHGDAYSETPQKGYNSTYFDGAGGVAGIPLTEEQRAALIKEAERRGMSEGDAYALAYGDGSEVRRTPDGKPLVDTSHVVLPQGPIFKRLTQSEQEQQSLTPANKPATTPQAAAQPGRHPTAQRQKPEPRPKPKLEGATRAKPEPGRKTGEEGANRPMPYYEDGRVDTDGNSPELNALSDDLHDFLPDPLDEMLSALMPFSAWIGDLSAPGTSPDISVQPDSDGGVTMTAVAQVSDDLTVTAHVVAPPSDDEHTPDPTVTVTVTDSQTGEVLSKSEPQVAESLEDVPRVAIGEVVDAVISASVTTHEDDDADLADAVQESGEDALDALPAEAGDETPQAPALGEPGHS
ncbi:hypothetical protein [Streptomyces sp. NPDC060131]|uniref:hypothetical protein n=1 Tax=unclassified Streptomyces TaxID=2593676 RepID=UPI00366545CC